MLFSWLRRLWHRLNRNHTDANQPAERRDVRWWG
jgi:hypothetical protein